MDWAYDAIGVEYSFAMEIFTRSIDVRDYLKKELLTLQTKNIKNLRRNSFI